MKEAGCFLELEHDYIEKDPDPGQNKLKSINVTSVILLGLMKNDWINFVFSVGSKRFRLDESWSRELSDSDICSPARAAASTFTSPSACARTTCASCCGHGRPSSYAAPLR